MAQSSISLTSHQRSSEYPLTFEPLGAKLAQLLSSEVVLKYAPGRTVLYRIPATDHYSRQAVATLVHSKASMA